MNSAALHAAVATVPPGAWAVAVSGGADSVALLALLRERSDLSLHVLHLDHETRDGTSGEDAAFVAQLASQWNLPVTVARIADIQPNHAAPRNVPSKFRHARFAFFRREIAARGLAGVILAHHRQDQAETIFGLLLHGVGPIGLGGITPHTTLNGLTVLRPLLATPKAALCGYLNQNGITWREDASNSSPKYLRSRIRHVLTAQPGVGEAMLNVGVAAAALRNALRAATPVLPERFHIAELRDLAPPLARHAARWWLIARGGAAHDLNDAAVRRLMAMVTDAASPPRAHFAGGILVRRRAGEIFAERSATGP